MRQTILFVAESVTLAQVVRLVSLARELDPARYDVHFACSAFPDFVFLGTGFARHRLWSVSPEQIAKALRSGRRLYDKSTLSRYVRDDLALFRATRPDVVVGDFRLSLPISAPAFGVPHVALANAYWSPCSSLREFPLPDHPMVRLLGQELAARHFPKALPYVFAHFARPVNALRKAYGLPPLGSLPEVLTHGDHVMYADTPSLAPISGAPSFHEFIGPVLWSPSPRAPLPEFAPSDARPNIYVTLGSSGRVEALPIVMEALSTMPVTALVATAGRPHFAKVATNLPVSDYWPGHVAARRSALVISNGGSSTGYQALAEGTPVLGIASNLDQFLAMRGIVAAGAGETLRASTLTVPAVRSAVQAMLASERHRERAKAVQTEFASWASGERFRDIVARVTGSAPARGATESRPSDRRRWGAPRALAASLLRSAGVTDGTARADDSRSIPSTNEIRFSTPVADNTGHVICALFRKDGWLKKPIQWKKVAIRDREAECVFTSVAPDVYGISAFHDENDNEKLDTNFLGIPTESWCTSRGAKAYFGPPSFDDAKFRYSGSVMRHRVSLR
jgi:UDP:flavonoid glycosyltransferase YjiC (YdhE family)/uncharacterized protein (DUF2141 family)